ncbi:MAG: hypothetical protein KDI30_02540, partial [Pseudomonadales bacterium]|nr:hypothetical protein [Pseudomonadales bacterium]
LASLLLGSRGIIQGLDFVKNLDEPDNAALSVLLEQEKKRFAGSEIRGKTLGVVGLGAIGSLVANMAIDLGMKVLGFDPALSVEAAWRLSHQVERMENLQSLLSKSDFVSLHLPMLEATRHLINDDTLSVVKPGCCLLNFAREGIVDTQAVIRSLDQPKSGLRCYISDFPVNELIRRNDVLLMPHIGASTEEAEENCAVMAADQLKDFLCNGNIKNSVNFPATYLERTSGYRLAISNRNIPKMLGHVLSVLADANINVIDMINKSRDEIAYNLIDIETAPDNAILEAISSIEGVVNIRLLEA